MTEIETSGFERNPSEMGFSLVEALIAIVILAIVLLSVATLFAYGTRVNTGNNTRSQTLGVLQQEIETIRAAKFTPLVTDSALLGGVKAQRTVTVTGQGSFLVDVTVDDDPLTNGVQVDNTKTLKEVTVIVAGPNTGNGWATSIPMTAVFRRVRSN